MFACPDCKEKFHHKVWHCPTCDHHWGMNRESCQNCHGSDRRLVPKSNVTGDSIVALVDKARLLLAEARDATDAKRVADMAHVAEVYAKRQKLSEEAIAYAHEIRIEAMTLLGEFLKAAPKNKGAKGSVVTGSRREPVKDATPTLADSGITKKDSAAAQFLSDLHDKAPEKHRAIKQGTKSLTEVKREVRRESAAKHTASAPAGKYRVIYADPPWKYGDSREALEGTTGASAHYPSMSITELCDLPVVEWIESDAVLFLWVTSPLLFECSPVIRAWGFQYKSSFVWDKIKHNIGHYNSVRHEFLLVCTRGSCLPDIPKLFDSVLSIERTTHSTKPEEFRTMIETLYPNGKRLEMFARKQADGWDVYGNEIDDALLRETA